MSRTASWMRRRVLTLAIVAIGIAAVSGTALAGHQASGAKSYTGCLTPGDGPIIKIKEGNSPRSACTGGQIEVHFSGGDITAITAQSGGGLTGGGENGAVSLSIRRDCANGQVVKWNGSAWACADDSNSTYTAGVGLDLSASGEFSVEESYGLPQTCASGEAATRNPATGGGAPTWICDQFATADQACATGQFAQGVTAVGALTCAAPTSGPGVNAFSASVGPVTLAGRTSVLSKTLPAGKYLLFASVELKNGDLDSTSAGSCDLSRQSGTIAATATHVVNELASTESLSLMGAIDHGGGSILLACTESIANVDVDSATLLAIRVDSIG